MRHSPVDKRSKRYAPKQCVSDYGMHRDAKRSARYRGKFTEETCPNHVASAGDPKICGRCGVHIDSLRPDNDREY